MGSQEKRGSLVILDGSTPRVRACVEYYRGVGRRVVLTPGGENRTERQELASHTFTLSAALGLVESGMDCVIAGLPHSILANQAMRMAFQRYSGFILGVDAGDIQSYPEVCEAAISIASNVVENAPSWSLERSQSGFTGNTRPSLIVAGFDAASYLPFHCVTGSGKLVHSGMYASKKRLGIALVDLLRCNPAMFNLLIEEGYKTNGVKPKVIRLGSSIHLSAGSPAHCGIESPSKFLRATKKRQNTWMEQLRDTIILSVE